MAQHPHKLALIDKKTWKCMNCGFFVHRGLTHVLIGKLAECWDCEETFMINDVALKEDKPRCNDCRIARVIEVIEEKVEPINPGEVLTEMTPEKRAMYKALGYIK